MNETVLDHRLVRDYLRVLDTATASLPDAQARELREQITAHLDEALPPQASDAEVNAELGRLGTPYSLAAEAAGPGSRSAARRVRDRLSRLRWWAWTLIATATAVIIAAAVFLNVMLSAEPLQQYGLSGWWFTQDSARAVHTSANGIVQWTVPERHGQRQGFVVGIRNDSDWTQTILGPDPNWEPGGQQDAGFAVGSGQSLDRTGLWDNRTRWVLPGSIPPHSYRLLRVLWTSITCSGHGSEIIITDLHLRVRVGLVTRTEDLPLGSAWGLSGSKASDCGGNG